MVVRRSMIAVGLAALVAVGCPYDQLSRSLGIAIAGRGGGGGGPRVLVMIQQPLRGTAGAIMTPAFLVGALDTLGHTDTAFSATVTMTLSNNPVGGRLSGTLQVNAVRGVASFADLVIDQASSNYVLKATAPNSSPAVSVPVTILAP